MHRKRFFPADLRAHPLHYAALRSQVDKIAKLINDRTINIYEPIQNGETALHVALTAYQSGDAQLMVAEKLIAEYSEDFERVQEYVNQKFPGNCSDQKWWMKRSILIASTLDQCETFKQLESIPGMSTIDMRYSIVVLLKYPIDNEYVAVIQSNKLDRMELFRAIKSVHHNGLLSWNSCGPTGKSDSLSMLAAYYGATEILERLIELGADIAMHGPEGRTTFHAACEASQNDVIQCLVTKHLDKFDPTALDDESKHGLHYILERKNVTSFKVVLEAMVKYRISKYNESPANAFNAIFKLENLDWPYSGIWMQLDNAFWGSILEKELEFYDYDLTYRWKEVVAIFDMVSFKKARKFYSKRLLENSELMRIDQNGYTVLHSLIATNDLLLVKQLYAKYSKETVEIFEREAAFSALASFTMSESMMKFVCEKHSIFLRENISKLLETVINASTNYSNLTVLQSCIPELKDKIEERKAYLFGISEAASNEFDDLYCRLAANFDETYNKIIQSGVSINHYTDKPLNRSSLNRAICENRLELVKNLLSVGFNFDPFDDGGCYAIDIETTEMLHLLVSLTQNGKSLVTKKDCNGFTMLHLLCSRWTPDKKELLLEMLKYGAQLNDRTHEQGTALFYTYDGELYDLITKTVALHGFAPADPDLTDHVNETALHRHLRQGNSYICSAMLQDAKSYVNFNLQHESYLCYLLRFEVDLFDRNFKPILENNPTKTSQMFKAEVKSSPDQTVKLFAEACLQKNVYCIDQFLKLDLDFTSRNESILVNLLNGPSLPDLELMKKVIAKGVDVNGVDQEGKNALMTLVLKAENYEDQKKFIDFWKMLIAEGTNLNAIDASGETVLHYAFRNMDLELIEELQSGGADFTVKNRQGKCPFEMCEYSDLFNFLT
ncbi:putative ankyrin repeat protein RF_0381 [Uranotaenia lowii]|uniref:putative ankyrin repeat protein RF_0381 n=1 Tax=Uranotaenia lowii TaxID=190385 RepID=UPI00247952FB|nr:putative ankyrin repeat protein RF_0381 [Uranotaenia lowii]